MIRASANYPRENATLIVLGCKVNGDLHVRRLVVELGAQFNGNCKMLADGEFEKLSGKPQPAQAAPAVKE